MPAEEALKALLTGLINSEDVFVDDLSKYYGDEPYSDPQKNILIRDEFYAKRLEAKYGRSLRTLRKYYRQMKSN